MPSLREWRNMGGREVGCSSQSSKIERLAKRRRSGVERGMG